MQQQNQIFEQGPAMKRRELAKALEHMCRAQSLLDGTDAPGEIGCHLDLAICCLKVMLRMKTDGLVGGVAIADPAAAEDCECPWNQKPF